MDERIIKFSPELPIPDFLCSEVQAKLAYLDESVAEGRVDATDGKITLRLNRQITPLEQKTLERKVQRVIEALVKGAFQPKVQILEDHLDREVPYRVDPMEELLATGEVYQEATGIFAVGPLVTRLMAFFEGHFLDLADSFGADPYRFPTLIPARYMERVNYFRAFPHSLSFATHLRSDLDIIEDFSQHAHCGDHGIDVDMGSFSKIEAILSPAVCYHLYFALADKPLPTESVTATAVGNCFRYESTNLISLERLWNFTMREVIFVGARDFVLENRETARKRMEAKFEEIGLSYRVESASDPFFIGESKQAVFQNAFQLKFEIRAALPFKNSTLAVGSYNYHQDFFGRSLKITRQDGSPAHTGCVAFGLERIVYAFLAQYGLDERNWPKAVQEGIL